MLTYVNRYDDPIETTFYGPQFHVLLDGEEIGDVRRDSLHEHWFYRLAYQRYGWAGVFRSRAEATKMLLVGVIKDLANEQPVANLLYRLMEEARERGVDVWRDIEVNTIEPDEEL